MTLNGTLVVVNDMISFEPFLVLKCFIVSEGKLSIAFRIFRGVVDSQLSKIKRGGVGEVKMN